MHRFNAETARYLREELHCKTLINASNWKTVNDIRLNDAERWSYTANEVMAVNRYYEPIHMGPDKAWRINKGDRFHNESVLLNPRALPLNIKQTVGYPMMITETAWPQPLGYQSEAPFLAAAYQSLNGVDAVFWVGAKELEWSNQDRNAFDADSQQKWIIATPMILGQFPAAALMYRRGDVALGQPVVVEHRSDKEVWERVRRSSPRTRSITPIVTSATGPSNRISQALSTRWPFSSDRSRSSMGRNPQRRPSPPEPLHRPHTENRSQQYGANHVGLWPGVLHGRRTQGTGRAPASLNRSVRSS